MPLVPLAFGPRPSVLGLPRGWGEKGLREKPLWLLGEGKGDVSYPDLGS